MWGLNLTPLSETQLFKLIQKCDSGLDWGLGLSEGELKTSLKIKEREKKASGDK